MPNTSSEQIFQFLFQLGVGIAGGVIVMGVAIAAGRYGATKAEDVLKAAAESSGLNSPHGGGNRRNFFNII